MKLETIIPVVELMIPTLKTIVDSNVSNLVEKAALIAVLDGLKSVADAYVQQNALK